MSVDINIIMEILAFAVLMGLSAFFSSSETALFSLNRLQLEQMRRDGKPSIALIERLLSQPRHLIVTILIGNELVNVSASVISAALVIHFLGVEQKWINLLIMVPVLLLVGEITPKSLAIRNNVAFASFQARFIELFARTITPLRWVVRHVADFFITIIVGKERSVANILTEDMVRSLTEEALGQGVLDREEAFYITRIFEFGAKTLRDVMTPRSQISFLAKDATLAQAAAEYRRTRHTKVPIYEGAKDAVVGVLYARDLLGANLKGRPRGDGDDTVAALMRDAYFVPESKSVADLFYTFRKRKLSLALIVDEYGGVTGLVTMEDLLECIFGEIQSSSELLRERRVGVEEVGQETYRIDGTMGLEQFNRLLKANLVNNSVETIGGLILDAFGELPSTGQRIVIDGFEFTIVSVSGRRVSQVTVEPAARLELEVTRSTQDQEAGSEKPQVADRNAPPQNGDTKSPTGR